METYWIEKNIPAGSGERCRNEKSPSPPSSNFYWQCRAWPWSMRPPPQYKGNTTTLAFFDSEGYVVASKKSGFRLEDTGKVKIFTFFNNVITTGPQKGQTDKAPKFYVYKVIGDTFVEVNGLLHSNDEEPVAFTWERVKE
jgi:hypothetical protein